MLCTLATIGYFIGAIPHAGMIVQVPRSTVNLYSKAKRRKAAECARSFKIRWVIDESK